MAEEQVVRETLTITHTNVTDADRNISARYNRLANLALDQAEMMMRHGPLDLRARMVSLFVSTTSRLASLDSRSEIETHRVAFEGLLASQRAVGVDTDPLEIAAAEAHLQPPLEPAAEPAIPAEPARQPLASHPPTAPRTEPPGAPYPPPFPG